MRVILVCVAVAYFAATSSATTLDQQARHLANHGGIRSSRYGDASPQMKRLAWKLVVQTFRRAGADSARRAVCIAGRESAWNPGAINSSSGAVGLFQFYGHPQWSSWRILHDPAYAVRAAWQLSRHGRDFGPWEGGSYRC